MHMVSSAKPRLESMKEVVPMVSVPMNRGWVGCLFRSVDNTRVPDDKEPPKYRASGAKLPMLSITLDMSVKVDACTVATTNPPALLNVDSNVAAMSFPYDDLSLIIRTRDTLKV